MGSPAKGSPAGKGPTKGKPVPAAAPVPKKGAPQKAPVAPKKAAVKRPAPVAPPAPAPEKSTMPGRNGGTLNRAKPGEVTNPKGRGKGRLNNKTILNRWLYQEVTVVNPASGKEEQMTALDAMNIALIGNAMKGDHKAYRELMDRLEGKPRQRIEMTGEDGGPIQQEIAHPDIDYDQLDDETLRKIRAARIRTNG